MFIVYNGKKSYAICKVKNNHSYEFFLPKLYLFLLGIFYKEIRFHLKIMNIKFFCIPESFNTNISHQLFEYTITFVNSQH